MDLSELIDEAFKAKPDAIEDFKNGKEKALHSLMGHVLKAEPRRNPKEVLDKIRERLGLPKAEPKVKKEKVIEEETGPKYTMSNRFELVEVEGKMKAVGRTIFELQETQEDGKSGQLFEFMYEDICSEESLLKTLEKGVPKWYTHYCRKLLIVTDEKTQQLFKKLDAIDGSK